MSRDIFNQIRLLGALSNLTVKASRDGEAGLLRTQLCVTHVDKTSQALPEENSPC